MFKIHDSSTMCFPKSRVFVAITFINADALENNQLPCQNITDFTAYTTLNRLTHIKEYMYIGSLKGWKPSKN